MSLVPGSSTTARTGMYGRLNVRSLHVFPPSMVRQTWLAPKRACTATAVRASRGSTAISVIGRPVGPTAEDHVSPRSWVYARRPSLDPTYTVSVSEPATPIAAMTPTDCTRFEPMLDH